MSHCSWNSKIVVLLWLMYNRSPNDSWVNIQVPHWCIWSHSSTCTRKINLGRSLVDFLIPNTSVFNKGVRNWSGKYVPKTVLVLISQNTAEVSSLARSILRAINKKTQEKLANNSEKEKVYSSADYFYIWTTVVQNRRKEYWKDKYAQKDYKL